MKIKKGTLAILFVALLFLINFSSVSYQGEKGELMLAEIVTINSANAESLTWNDLKAIHQWIDDTLIPGNWYSSYTNWVYDTTHKILDSLDIVGDPEYGWVTDPKTGTTAYALVNECDGNPNFCGGWL